MMRVLALIVFFLANAATAKPMHSDAATILKKTRALVTGVATGQPGETQTFKVHTVLWDPDAVIGARSQLPLSTKGIHAGVDLLPDRGVVLFVDVHRQPVYVAEPATPQRPKALGVHPLRMRGFYAYNAHLTTPAIATMAGLVRAMKARRFEERLAAQVGFGDVRAPAMVLRARLVDGVVVDLSGKTATSDARVVGWDYQMQLSLTGKSPAVLRGGFHAVKHGVLVAYLVPDEPFVPDHGALERWRTTGKIALPIRVTHAEAKAILTLTGQTKGTLGPGLGVEGQLAGFLRQDENGYRSQSGAHSKGKAPGHGWHIEVATPKGPLWITLALPEIDAAPRRVLRGIVSLQTHLYLALRTGARPVRFSGALTGAGTLSVIGPALPR